MKIKKLYMAVLVSSFLLVGCNETEGALTSDELDLLTAGPVVDSASQISSMGNEETENDNNNTDSGSTIRVFVCGEVNSPGVYELESTARVCDAIILAGDFAKDADTEYLNQAATLTDGQKLYVPSEEEAASGLAEGTPDTDKGSSGSGSIYNAGDDGSASAGLVNINTASVSELKSLPGIGDVKAGAIVSYREEHGKFTSEEQIMQVDGIGSGLYDNIKDKICVGN